MEKGYKKQHYVPCLYLSEFIIQTKDNLAIENTRKRFINALFKNGMTKKIPIDSQGQNTFHFSKKDREVKEKAISETETSYKKVLNKFLSLPKSAKNLKKAEILTLFTFLHQIHFGNPVYEIDGDDERFAIWNSITADFIGKELLGIKAASTLPKIEYFKQILDKAFEEFHFIILERDSNTDPIITSDNPAVIFSDSSKNGEVSLGLLPLTPNFLFVYCRKTAGTFVNNKLNKMDTARINGVQVNSCRNAVYSNEEFETTDIDAFKKIKQNSTINLGGFQTTYSYETRLFEADISTLDFITTPNNNRTTILINGHPNAGKSTIRKTLRKQLSKDIQFFEVDYDKNFQTYMNSLGKLDIKNFRKTKNYILNKLIDASSKVNLVSDMLLETNALIKLSMEVKNTGAKTILVRLFCNDVIRLKRDKKRKRNNSNAPHGFNDSLNPNPSYFYDLQIDTSSKSINSICNEIVDYIKNKDSQS